MRGETTKRPNIIHVMKDGTVLSSVKGHVVREEDCPEFYKWLDKINSERLAAARVNREGRT